MVNEQSRGMIREAIAQAAAIEEFLERSRVLQDRGLSRELAELLREGRSWVLLERLETGSDDDLARLSEYHRANPEQVLNAPRDAKGPAQGT